MKHRWTTLLWELFAAQVLCTAAAMLPGSRVCTMPGLALKIIFKFTLTIKFFALK